MALDPDCIRRRAEARLHEARRQALHDQTLAAQKLTFTPTPDPIPVEAKQEDSPEKREVEWGIG